jgi:hypothetical protein
MKKIEILAIGKTTRIMETILRLINSKTQLNGSIVFSADEAVKKSKTIAFDMVLIGAGLDEDETQQVHSYFTIPVVQHYGGGSGLLYAEINQTLGINVIG